jgi:hypothetical protein
MCIELALTPHRYPHFGGKNLKFIEAIRDVFEGKPFIPVVVET